MDKNCTAEENRILFQQILDGEEGAKERFITGNMAYVVAVAEDYVGKRPQFEYLQDDLISEGYLVLVKLSEKILHDDNPQGLLTTCLKHAFTKLVMREEKRKTEPLDKNLVWNNKYENCSRHEVLIACADDLEKRIMTMHLDGHADRKIAHILNMTRPHVLRIRHKIKKKLKK